MALTDDLESQKAYQRITHDADDALVSANLTAAAEWFERETSYAVESRSYSVALSKWRREITLWPVPLVAVASVTYTGDDGDDHTVEATDYHVTTHSRPGRLVFASDYSFPPLADGVPEPIRITYSCGHATAEDMPDTLIAGVRLLASHLYEQRTPVTEVAANELPMGIQRIIDLHRFPRGEEVE